MAKYLIQDDILTIMANKAREITNIEEQLNCAEILEIMSRTQGTVKTDGEYYAEAFDSQGNIIKSGNYDTGEVFAMPTAPIKDGMTFQNWVCTSPLENGHYTVINNAPVNAGAVYIPNDDTFVITVNIVEANTIVYFYLVKNDAVIDWGDGIIDSTESYNELQHTYTEIGTYTIQIFGNIRIRYYDNDSGYLGYIAKDNSIIKNIQIPSYITDINKGFFDGTSIENISLHDGITTIRNGAFGSCKLLTHIIIPNSVINFGNYMFSGCSNLKKVVLPYKMTELPNGTFRDCSSLSSIILPSELTSIGNYAFYNCTLLTSIKIPEGVTSIGNYAFYYCTSLASIQIPEGVTSIGDYAFFIHSGDSSVSNYNVLKTLIFPTTLTNIGNELFGDREVDNFVLLANEVCTVNGTLFQKGMSESYINNFKNIKIYVPDSLVNSYKTHEYWGTLSSKIKPLSQYEGVI